MSTLVVGTIVFACIGLAGFSVYKSRKKGTGCGCGCSGCHKAGNGGCH